MYDYQEERKAVFTEEGQVLFLRVRDYVQQLLKTAGAFQMGAVLGGIGGSFDTWKAMACVDRLIELGEIYEVTRVGAHGEITHVAGQYRTFVGKNS